MDESSANAYYDAQRTKGLGAAKFKRGLGYKPPEEASTNQSIPPTPLPTPYMMPSGQPSRLPYPTAYPYGYLPRPAGFPMTQAASPQLPSSVAASAWTAHRSGEAVYYYNTMTGVSQWERPLEFVGEVPEPDATPKPVASERIHNTKWTEVKCEDGRVYYYNLETKVTSWTVPDEVLKVRHPTLSSALRPGSIPCITVKKPEAPLEVKKGRRATPEEIKAFQNLLQESEVHDTEYENFIVMFTVKVTAFARYEMEATKLEDDERWQGVSLEKERRSLFAEYCTRCAQQQRHRRHTTMTDSNTANQQRNTDKDVKDNVDQISSSEKIKEKEKAEAIIVQYPEESILKDPKQWHRNHPSDSPSTDRRKGSEEEKQKRAREEQEVINSRCRLRQATHEAAISDFQTLLSELVKQPTLSWESVRDRLEADIQGRGTHPMMEDVDRKRLFYDHVDRIHDHAMHDYLRVLQEQMGPAPEKEADQKLEALGWGSYEEAERKLENVFIAVQPTDDAKQKIWQLHTAKWREETTPTLEEIIHSCRPSRHRRH